MTSIQKQTLFFDVLNIQDTSSITKALIPNIQKYYIKIIQNKFLVNLNEDEIRAIDETYRYQENLLKKKEDTIRLIDEKGLLISDFYMSNADFKEVHGKSFEDLLSNQKRPTIYKSSLK